MNIEMLTKEFANCELWVKTHTECYAAAVDAHMRATNGNPDQAAMGELYIDFLAAVQPHLAMAQAIHDAINSTSH